MSNNKYSQTDFVAKMDWELIVCGRVWSWILKCELYNYVSWNLPTSLVLSVLRFSSNVNTISAAEMGISTASTPCSCRNFCHVLGLKIALILLLRHFWTLNFSSLKQRNNIYKLTQTWNSKWSSYTYSTWQRTNVRTLRVCLQQKSSKVTWNYTWNLTLRRWILLGFHCKFADEVLRAWDYSSCSVVLHVVILARLITASANCACTYIVVLSKIS